MKFDFPDGTLYHTDAFEILPEIPDESIDLILTDPPYMISREVVISRSGNTKFKAKDIELDFGDWDKAWASKEDYYDWMFAWLKEAYRVLKNESHLLFFIDKFKITPFVEYLEGLGMKARGPLLWIKSNPMPMARKVSFTQAYEMCLWFTKGRVSQRKFNWELGYHPNYVVAPIPQPHLHPTMKPIKVLLVWIAYLSKPGEIVLDPFAGSGTTLLAAQKLGRRFIGIEKEEEYVQIILKQLQQPQLDLC